MFTHKYDSIITIENLLQTWERFLSGKRHKKDVIKFQVELAVNICDLFKDLKNKTYGSGVDFLGWVHFPHHRQIRTTTKKKIMRMMNGYPKRETVSSYRGLLGLGDTFELQKRINIKSVN